MSITNYKIIADKLKLIVGEDNVLSEHIDLALYSCDAETLDNSAPDLVVLPANTEQLQAVIRLANNYNVSFTARGAGTGLSGGATTVCGGISLVLSRMTKIIKIDPEERTATVEVGVTNSSVSQAASVHSLYFAPDPSSQLASTIGGNIAENAGGPHTLKYGTTVDHILAIKIVLPNGDLVEFQDKSPCLGLDWLSLIAGSEGTLGIVSEATLKLIPIPEAVETALVYFPTLEDGGQTVSKIIASGIIPCALEMMDQLTLNAVEDAFSLGLNRKAEALLIIEIDGTRANVDTEKKQIASILDVCNNLGYFWATSSVERTAMWKARKAAFGALGRIAPHGYVLDGVVPRSKLAAAIRGIKEIADKYSVTIANIFHAGDGNLHPCILYNQSDRKQVDLVLKAAYEILKLGVDLGGALSGEHGIGIEKRSAMTFSFSNADLQAMGFVKEAFDPNFLCNPGKVLPNPGMCGESGIRPLLRHKLSLGC